VSSSRPHDTVEFIASTAPTFTGGQSVQMPTPRRMIYAGLAVLAVTVATAALLLAFSVVSAAVAIALFFGATCSAALAVTFAFVRRIDVRIDQLARQQAQSKRDGERQFAGLANQVERLDGRVSRSREWVSRDVLIGYQQLEAVVDLRALIRPRAPMPPLRGWALSPDALRLLVQEIYARHPQLIVECGSGSSTIWLGYTVQQLGTGHVVALEHDERFAQLSQDLLKAHGLEDVVEVRYAPLKPWETQPWYDLRAIDDLEKIGLLLVDGPPGTVGEGARYPAVPLLLSKCADNALIVLDDVIREQESAVSDRWLAEFPELHRTIHDTFEKGLHVFQRELK
jgi:predicted O-methyltransferase YrrM